MLWKGTEQTNAYDSDSKSKPKCFLKPNNRIEIVEKCSPNLEFRPAIKWRRTMKQEKKKPSAQMRIHHRVHIARIHFRRCLFRLCCFCLPVPADNPEMPEPELFTRMLFLILSDMVSFKKKNQFYIEANCVTHPYDQKTKRWKPHNSRKSSFLLAFLFSIRKKNDQNKVMRMQFE